MSSLTTYRTSLQIFLFNKFFCTNIFQVELEILRNSPTIFRSSHCSHSIKKAILKDFVRFTGKHLCWSLFFNKLAGLSPVTLLKRNSNTDVFFANIEKFGRSPILKNICEQLHFRKVFQVQDLAKETTDDLLCQVSQD